MNETFRVLIDTFGKGWERGDVDAICSVFTEDAVFLETPFSTPDRGMAAIRAYWWPVDGSHTRITSFERKIVEIAGTRGLAYVHGIGTLAWQYAKGGTPQTQSSRSTDLILVAPDPAGHWRVVRQMWSTLP